MTTTRLCPNTSSPTFETSSAPWPSRTTRLAHYLAEVNAVHPFREGEGSTQRAFFSQLAYDAGYELAWAEVDAVANVEASIISLNGDNSKLAALLADITEPLDHRS